MSTAERFPRRFAVLMRFLGTLLLGIATLGAGPSLGANELDQTGPLFLPRMFDRQVVPGVRIGPLDLSMSEARVVEMLGQPENVESPFEGTRLLAWRNLGLDVTVARGRLLRVRAVGPGWQCGGLSLRSSPSEWSNRFPELRSGAGLLVAPALGLCLETDLDERVIRAISVMDPSGNWSGFKQVSPSADL